MLRWIRSGRSAVAQMKSRFCAPRAQRPGDCGPGGYGRGSGRTRQWADGAVGGRGSGRTGQLRSVAFGVESAECDPEPR